MKALLLLATLISNVAIASQCEILEDPPVSDVICYEQRPNPMPIGSEWTRLYANPTSLGLFSNGGLTADISLQMNANTALVGQLLPTGPDLLGTSKVWSKELSSAWVNVDLQHAANGSNYLQITSYSSSGGVTSVTGNATSQPVGSGTAASYRLSYTFSAGALNISVKSSTAQILAQLSVANFGQTLPTMKLRRGAQPVASGLVSANFVQAGGWGN
jgi:hypothetical protein